VLQPVVLDLAEVVRDLESMLRRLIGEHIELVTCLDGAAGRVRADRNQVEHAPGVRWDRSGGLTLGRSGFRLSGEPILTPPCKM
jgi:hypothetical protein